MFLLKKIFGSSKKENSVAPKAQTQNMTNIYTPLVLWWVDKKSGYDITQSKIPSWFASEYDIDFNLEVSKYLNKGYLEYATATKVVLSKVGRQELEKYNCVVIMHNHPEYYLQYSDFTTHSQWHIVSDNDIIWEMFNRRQLIYTQNKQWDDLKNNYVNMSSLLLEENKYNEALKLLFPAAFIATSGMHNKNILCPFEVNDGYLWVTNLEISNYNISNVVRKVMKISRLTLGEISEKYIQSEYVIAVKNLLPFYYLDISESLKMLESAIKANIEKGIFTLGDMKKLGIKLKFNVPNANSKTYFYNSVENQMRAIKFNN